MLSFDRYSRLAAAGLSRFAAWRIALLVLLIVAIHVIANFLVLGLLLSLQDLMALESAAPVSARVTRVVLIPFGLILIGFLLAHRLVCKAPVGVLFAVTPGRFWGRFVLGVALTLVFTGAMALLPLAEVETIAQMTVQAWLPLLPLALGLLAVQTLTEEVIFRGFLQRYLAARFHSPLIWWLLPSFVFGALHYRPATYGPSAALVAVAAGVLALMLADITARTGSIAVAWGIHFCNNAISVLVVALPGPLSGLGLYLIDIDPTDAAAMTPSVLASTVQIAVVYGLYLAWIILRRKPARRLQNPPGGSI